MTDLIEKIQTFHNLHSIRNTKQSFTQNLYDCKIWCKINRKRELFKYPIFHLTIAQKFKSILKWNNRTRETYKNGFRLRNLSLLQNTKVNFNETAIWKQESRASGSVSLISFHERHLLLNNYFYTNSPCYIKCIE